MITEVDPNTVVLKALIAEYKGKLDDAYTAINILEKQTADLKATIAKQQVDLEFATQDKKELEDALKFKPIYA